MKAIVRAGLETPVRADRRPELPTRITEAMVYRASEKLVEAVGVGVAG